MLLIFGIVIAHSRGLRGLITLMPKVEHVTGATFHHKFYGTTFSVVPQPLPSSLCYAFYRVMHRFFAHFIRPGFIVIVSGRGNEKLLPPLHPFFLLLLGFHEIWGKTKRTVFACLRQIYFLLYHVHPLSWRRGECLKMFSTNLPRSKKGKNDIKGGILRALLYHKQHERNVCWSKKFKRKN